MSERLICPYCNRDSILVRGNVIYKHRPDLASKWFYQCVPCGAYVGCHPRTSRPLGLPANARLRKARSAAHAAFDPIWKSGKKTRAEAYRWLAENIGVSNANCHIGMMDEDACAAVVAACGMHRVAS